MSATESRKVAGMPFRMLVKIKVQRMAAARKMKVTKRVRLALRWSEVARRTIEVTAPETRTMPTTASTALVLM